jgi:hypothetical protein
MGLTSGERILLFLSTARPADEGFGGFDQDTLARECGIGRTHIPRSVKPLIDRALITEDKGRLPGKARLVKRYSITKEGIEEAQSLHEIIDTMKISLVGPDGLKNTTDPKSIMSLANAYLVSMSKTPLTLSLVLSNEGDILEWEDILSLSGSREGASTIDLPAGWESIPPPEVPEGYVPRQKEESALSTMLDDQDVSILLGKQGSGRRTLIAYVLRSQGQRALWIRKVPGKQSSKATSGADILVMIGDVLSDPSNMLMRECMPDVVDPRDEGWDDALREMRLVILSSEECSVHAPTLRVGPLELEAFAEALRGTGLDEGVVRSIHTASQGAPSAIRILKEMGEGDLRSFSGPASEEAIFRLLIAIGRSKGNTKNT